MQITRLDQLEIGGKYYSANVYSKDNNGGVDRWLLNSIGKDGKWLDTVHIPIGEFQLMQFKNGEWLTYGSKLDLSGYSHETSSQDRGIIANNYNQHRVYTTLEEAQAWVEEALGVVFDNYVEVGNPEGYDAVDQGHMIPEEFHFQPGLFKQGDGIGLREPEITPPNGCAEVAGEAPEVTSVGNANLLTIA